MRVKTLVHFTKSGGGLLPIGTILDLGPDDYERHVADGNVELVEVAEAREQGAAEAARIMAEAEAKAAALLKATREKTAADIEKAKAKAKG